MVPDRLSSQTRLGGGGSDTESGVGPRSQTTRATGASIESGRTSNPGVSVPTWDDTDVGRYRRLHHDGAQGKVVTKTSELEKREGDGLTDMPPRLHRVKVWTIGKPKTDSITESR